MSRPEANDRIVGRALSHIANRADARVLDLGCGSGALAVSIARARRDVQVTAIDISPANAASVSEAAAAAGVAERIEAVCADYLTGPRNRYDLIVSDSVLHLIDGSDDALTSCLAADLADGGAVIAATPVKSPFNQLRILLRRLWRLTPTIADKLVFAIARRVYPAMPPEILAGRIPYLRVLPVRLYGPEMNAAFNKAGFDVIDDELLPNESAAKLKHALVVWRRR